MRKCLSDFFGVGIPKESKILASLLLKNLNDYLDIVYNFIIKQGV